MHISGMEMDANLFNHEFVSLKTIQKAGKGQKGEAKPGIQGRSDMRK